MTRMTSSDNSKRTTDLVDDLKGLEDTGDSCRHFSSSRKRKRDEANCGSPTSSKDSHSDRDSDYDDSNGEHAGKLRGSLLNLENFHHKFLWHFNINPSKQSSYTYMR